MYNAGKRQQTSGIVYQEITSYSETETVGPLAMSGASVIVAELLP